MNKERGDARTASDARTANDTRTAKPSDSIETQVLVAEMLESPYPYCIIPPRFFDRMLARLDERDVDILKRRGYEAKRARM